MWGTKDHRYNPGYYPGSHPLPLGSLRRVLSFTHIYRLCRDNTQQIQFFHILKPSLQLKYSLLMSTPHLQFILDKTELLFLAGFSSFLPIDNLFINIGNSVVPSTQTARMKSFAVNIASTPRSSRCILFSIRRISSFLSQKASQVLVQALVISCRNNCIYLLAGLSACAICPICVGLYSNDSGTFWVRSSLLMALNVSRFGRKCQLNTCHVM